VFALVDVNSLADAGQVENLFLFFGSMGVTGQCGKQAHHGKDHTELLGGVVDGHREWYPVDQ
jgi:hypothetical protein